MCRGEAEKFMDRLGKFGGQWMKGTGGQEVLCAESWVWLYMGLLVKTLGEGD